MPKKPDRFKRAVEKHVYANQWDMPVINASRAAKLLRAEHAWMRKCIAKHKSKTVSAPHIVFNQLIDRLLGDLAQRRK